jgi:hypothetical protein
MLRQLHSVLSAATTPNEEIYPKSNHLPGDVAIVRFCWWLLFDG